MAPNSLLICVYTSVTIYSSPRSHSQKLDRPHKSKIALFLDSVSRNLIPYIPFLPKTTPNLNNAKISTYPWKSHSTA